MAEELSAGGHEQEEESALSESTPESAGPDASDTKLTPEDVAYMESVQKKRLVIMIIAGIVVLVLGFLAGKNLASLKSDAGTAAPTGVVVLVPAGGSADSLDSLLATPVPETATTPATTAMPTGEEDSRCPGGSPSPDCLGETCDGSVTASTVGYVDAGL